jgi:hypothetical protein
MLDERNARIDSLTKLVSLLQGLLEVLEQKKE